MGQTLSAAGSVLKQPSKHQTTKRVLCAAGDGNAYEWDLESLAAAVGIGDKNGAPVRTYEGGKGYLHAVAVSSNSCNCLHICIIRTHCCVSTAVLFGKFHVISQ